jgi:hypothetical protein
MLFSKSINYKSDIKYNCIGDSCKISISDKIFINNRLNIRLNNVKNFRILLNYKLYKK